MDQVPNFTIAPLFGAPSAKASPVVSSDEAPTASLVGSLTVFTLSDVLSLLAATGQTGELQLVSTSVDGKVWLEHGELSNAHVGSASTMGQAVFELACASDGWFYFTDGLTSSSGQPTVPVAAVLNEVRPQVEEWRELQQVVPLEATVSLSPTPPGQDVQIRADQWRVLTTVGTGGSSVKEIIDLIDSDQIVGLRTLRDLQAAGLIILGTAAGPSVDDLAEPYLVAPDETPGTSPLPAPPPPMTLVDELRVDEAPPPPTPEPVGAESSFGSLAEVAIMPPPIAGDPWSTVVEASTVGGTNSDNGVA